MTRTVFFLLAWCLPWLFQSPDACADETNLRVCFWNVESGGASPTVNARRIRDENGVHVWGLSEVKNSTDAARYLVASKAGEPGDFESVLGTTGGQDRLLILFDSDKLELMESFELHDINIGSRVRAPLVAHFKLQETGREFFFMVNHLYRGNATARHTQTRKINNWVESQSLPTIVGGDMNLDWHFEQGETEHDEGFDLLVEDGVLNWVRPEVLVPTNSSSHESVLDFVFVGGEAITWSAESTILVKPGDFPDGTSRSDHRPVDCVFSIPSVSEPVGPTLLTMAEAQALIAPRDTDTRTAREARAMEATSGHSYEDLRRRLESLEKELERMRAVFEGEE